jgi:nicotinamidase-related amidase
VRKNKFSGFYETNLKDVLEDLDVDEVTVVGVCTHICIMDTVQGASYLRLKINVPRDMVADIDPDQEEAALKRMAAIYGANII